MIALSGLSAFGAFGAAALAATPGMAIGQSKGSAPSHESEPVFYRNQPMVKQFVERMQREHQLDPAATANLLAQAERRQSILDAISRPAEKTKPWHEYRDIFLKADRIQQGVAFWQANAATLRQAAGRYGVDPAIIVAIIGVETRYGGFMGNHRVLDALATLAFDYPPRSEFFTKELEQFLLLTREQRQDPLALKGSYAGAMGYGQFMPSSYRAYARDQDGDGFIDIWNNKHDAIGSVANYFKAHGWQSGAPVMAPAQLASDVDRSLLNSRDQPSTTLSEWQRLGYSVVGGADSVGLQPQAAVAVALEYSGAAGPEYWMGFSNFYVITRYNRSHLYARAVWELSQAIAAAKAGGTAHVD